MNIGIEIREKKLAKHMRKQNTIKPDQENIFRFVTISYQNFERINGKYKRTGSKTANGLQIKNRVYMKDGSYKLINGKGVIIRKTFDGIPEWAADILIDKYNKISNMEKSSDL